MPETKVWNGGTPGDAKVDTITIPEDVVAGLVFTATIGDKTLTYTIPADASAADVAAAIVALWNDSDVTEFAERTAADAGDGVFTITADEEGKPFILSVVIGSGNNEKQSVTIGGNPTGGTFTLAVGGQVTDPINHDATGATVEAKLEALSTVGAGNVSVTGDGPYVIEFTGTLAGTNIAPIGANADNLTVPPEVQELDLGSPTGGTWTAKLGASGTPTSALAYNITAASLQTALEGLPEILPGNVGVSGPDGGPFTVTFQGAFNGVDVDDLIIDGSNLTGGLADSVTVTEQTAGGGGGNEVWRVLSTHQGTQAGWFEIGGNASVTGGTFDVVLQTTDTSTTVFSLTNVPYDVSPQELQDLIDADILSRWTSSYVGTVFVGGMDYTSFTAASRLNNGDRYAIVVSSKFGEGYYELNVDDTNITGGSATYSGVPYTDHIYFTGGYSTAEWRILVNGEATSWLSYEAGAINVLTALEGLSTIGSGDVSVTKIGGANLSVGSGFVIEFQGNLANQNTGFSFGLESNYGTALTGWNPTHQFVTNRNIQWRGTAGTSEVQRVSITGSPGAGQFGLKFGAGYSAVIAYDTTASELQAILEAVPTIGAGNVSCSGGPLPDSYIDVTFQGGLSGSDLADMVPVQGTFSTTADGGNPATITVATVQTPLTHEVTTESSGPNDWNTAANWDTGTVPADGDTVIIPNGPNILYGLDQSDLSLALLLIEDSDTQIGLPRRTEQDEIEYLPRFLKLSADKIIVGQGTRGGSQRINLEPVNADVEIIVYNSLSGPDDEEAVLIRNVNSANTAKLTLFNGQVGIATNPKDEAYFKSIFQRGGFLNIGSDVGLEQLERTAGQVSVYQASMNGTLTL